MDEQGWAASEQRARALAEEATSLVKAGQTLGPRWLGPAVSWLAQAAPAWEVATGEVPDERAYRLLVSSLHLEAWLICWPPGGRLELHDHGGASGAFVVVRGSLREAFLPAGAFRPRARDLAVGETVAFDGSYVHDVLNLGPAATTSVHLYGTATRSMSFYRLHPASGGAVRVGPVEPAVSIGETTGRVDRLEA